MVLTGENERLQGEVSRLQMEREELKQEANAAREHYETYGAQLNQNIVQISARVIIAFMSTKIALMLNAFPFILSQSSLVSQFKKIRSFFLVLVYLLVSKMLRTRRQLDFFVCKITSVTRQRDSPKFFSNHCGIVFEKSKIWWFFRIL